MSSARRHAGRVSLVCVSALAALVAAGCGAAGVDRALPDVALESIGGGTYELHQTGQPRVLNLWATWCAPCRAELPAFDAVAAIVDDVEIIGVNTGETEADAAELVAELGLTFPQVLDPEATVQAALKITGMPSTIFVDASGDIVEIHSGELERGELEARLTEHFATSFDR